MVRSPARIALQALGILSTVLCASAPGVAHSPTPAAAPARHAPPQERPDQFTLLSYNVAGLPGLVSASDPVHNTPLISRLLNLYDLAVVQEDFAYHRELRSRARHAFQSDPAEVGPATGMGDGLNRFSEVPFRRFFRSTWQACHGELGYGSDCLTAKGFSVAEHRIAPGVSVDVYNVHLDSGESTGDSRARAAQANQLAQFIARWSPGKAVIVAGDTNLLESEESVYGAFMRAAGLADACRQLACPSRFALDRVLFRSSQAVRLEPLRYFLDRRFVSTEGRALSDHEAVGVVFRWNRQAAAPERVTARLASPHPGNPARP